MYNINTEFKKFYYNEVVLSKDETNRLRKSKKLNIDRLKDGLVEYNKENKTDYKVAETLEQGSVAMSTVTQNESKDYDIDVAIIFDKDILPEGTTATKNIIVNALKKKCTGFKTPPEAKPNCVRIEYADGYHIDFAVYRRTKSSDGSYSYEHCGSEWRPRDPRAITKWFKDEIKIKGEKLRRAVRLSKMFCKSRESWIMPGGLIQSVLCDEKIQSYERMDEMFYYTMKEIKNRLETDTEVLNPADSMQSLLLVGKDDIRVTNLKNRLDTHLSKLDILFDDKCTEQQAIEAWHSLFNHDFWTYEEGQDKVAKSMVLAEMFSKYIIQFDDTEEEIENIMPVNDIFNLKIDCRIESSNSHISSYKLLSNVLRSNQTIRIGEKLKFFIDHTNVPGAYDIYWKVTNRGCVAEEKNCMRGDIFKTEISDLKLRKYLEESADFPGDHTVECYLVKSGICVARNEIRVPIR